MHTGGVRGGGGYETAPPRQIFEKLVNENAIKRKIGVPPQWGKSCKFVPIGKMKKTFFDLQIDFV